ncbi:VWA domain-containing protein [Halobaculum gomorrense]|uniref:VWA domain containing CoxE-like protein n=1 Tax=Halobaculum gomorrense TaxID=43928 RepID=A0A1M5T2Q2_9EURY|nr:VWA domain-containing protein [Halobaculum gomorrense]SHH44952.1 hypothetical protein SAMN05443636_2615 [Halobaculum gomorrense]
MTDRTDVPAAEEPPAETGAPAAIGGDGVPDFRAARRHVLIELVRLAAVLRRDGVDVPPSGTLAAARALSVVGLSDRDRAAAALRASLLSAVDDGDAFDEAFPTFWHRLRSGLSAVATDHDGPEADAADGDDEDDPPDAVEPSDGADADTLEGAEAPDLSGDDDGPPAEVRIPTGRRRATGERATDDGEHDRRRASAVSGGEAVEGRPATTRDGRAAVERFVDALAARSGRRRRPSPTGAQVDARRALRSSLATGGAPVDLPATTATETELRCCLLVDVSGSVLDTTDRNALLSVADAVSAAARDARVFLFDTELADATAAFARAGGDPAAALREAEIRWGGGTEIGAALETLRREHPDAVDRRTVVVVVSDGLDVGDPDLLDRGITWLAERAAAVVWLNPLAVSPSFEPRSRGMAACEPYVDALFGFAGPEDLAAAARQIERRGLSGPVGYRHDPRRRASDGGDRA